MNTKEFKDDNSFDSEIDFSRVLMSMNIIEICGENLKKDKLNEYINYLQLYILSKKFLPSDVENRVLNVLEGIMGKHLTIYNDFTTAIKESQKFGGLDDKGDLGGTSCLS